MGTCPRAARWEEREETCRRSGRAEAGRAPSPTVGHGRDLRAAAKGDGNTKRSAGNFLAESDLPNRPVRATALECLIIARTDTSAEIAGRLQRPKLAGPQLAPRRIE